ncbi:MAG: sulfite exporter TauE/SafE family protein [Geminicoccaceae bacterium]
MWQAENLALVALTFLLAGFVKGIVGLGLPTIVLGILTTTYGITPAIAIMLVPSLVTNAIQGLGGQTSLAVLRRIWPLLLAAAVGIVVGAGVLARSSGTGPAITLGLLIMLHGGVSLLGPKLPHPGRHERWLSPLAGLANGLITGFTGSAILPGMLYIQALGFDKERLVQAMGLLFGISTLVLMVAFARYELLTPDLALLSALALLPALLGLRLGARLRRRIAEERFRRLLYVVLIALGGAIVWRNIG